MTALRKRFFCFAVLMMAAGTLHAESAAAKLLIQCCDLTAGDIEKLDKGEAVSRVVAGGHSPDLALMGAVRLSVSREQYLRWYRNLDNFLKSPLVQKVGQFHSPPQEEDVAEMQVFGNEVKKFQKCRPGACSAKLTLDELAHFDQDMDWNAPGMGERVNVLARREVQSYVARYMKDGDTALGKYGDRQPPTDITGTFRSIVEASGALRSAFPDAFEKVSRYQGGLGDGEFVYWTRESYGFGLKPLVNIVHVMTFDPQPGVTLVCAKQLRATHYYDGSLGVTVLVDADPGTYLVYVNRSRIDLLRGAGWKKSLVEHRGAGAAKKEMQQLKKRIEE